MARDRLTEIVIKPSKVFGTFFTVDEWNLPFEEVFEYDIWFRELHIGKFWISNLHSDSVHMFSPVDVEVIQYVISEMENRSMKKDWKKEKF